MAVAPLPNVRAVLDYAVTELPAEKLLLGVPNYGYDWPLPVVQGQTRARSISNQQAIELALQYRIAIQYDESAQSPYFHYTAEGGIIHEVWFEDARSLSAKLRLIAEYGFLGGGIWNLMRPFSQIWLVADSLYDIALYFLCPERSAFRGIFPFFASFLQSWHCLFCKISAHFPKIN